MPSTRTVKVIVTVLSFDIDTVEEDMVSDSFTDDWLPDVSNKEILDGLIETLTREEY